MVRPRAWQGLYHRFCTRRVAKKTTRKPPSGLAPRRKRKGRNTECRRHRWSERGGLNARPPDPKSGALPTELHPDMAGMVRVELTCEGVKVPCLAAWRHPQMKSAGLSRLSPVSPGCLHSFAVFGVTLNGLAHVFPWCRNNGPVTASSFRGVTTASASRLVVSGLHRWRRTADLNHTPFSAFRFQDGSGTSPVHPAYNPLHEGVGQLSLLPYEQSCLSTSGTPVGQDQHDFPGLHITDASSASQIRTDNLRRITAALSPI